MYKKAKILFFCMIFVAKGVFCQIADEKMARPTDIKSSKSPSQAFFRPDINTYFKANNKNQGPASVIKADFYTQNFGFFCKKELQFEKATKVLFKFRLGSVQYCDWMEGKKSAGILAAY
jgi:hypothetical protein